MQCTNDLVAKIGCRFDAGLHPVPFLVSIGFATLFGIVVMDGVLMVKEITRRRLMGQSIDKAIIGSRVDLLRPSLMASLVAIFGLVPASLATSLGSDVQRPLATVIVWGLAGSTLLMLFVTPAFYRLVVPSLPREEDDEVMVSS